MDDDKIIEFEKKIKSELNSTGIEIPDPQQVSVNIKKDDISEIQSLGGFVAWFISWDFKNILTWPFIYGMVIPLWILNITVSLYQAICFRVYGIQRVIRSDYFYPKRSKLKYLNIVEKMNCDYCGYANGTIAFAREVFARTEQHWCPIKHASRIKGAHERYEKFLKFGEKDGYETKLEILRAEISGKPG